MKNTDSFEAFRSSLLRCLSNLRFLELFYDTFTASSPQVKEVFAHTDMERQKAMLNASLYQLMNFYENDDEQARRHIEELGAVHGVYGHKIPISLYDLWLESLLKAVKASDPHFSPALESIWKEVMAMGIEIMKSSSHRYPPRAPQEAAEEEDARTIRTTDLENVIERLRVFSKEASHRSNIEKDMEVTAFQFGQYRAYLHASEILSDLIGKEIRA